MEGIRNTDSVAARQGPAAMLEVLYRAEYVGMVRLAFTLIGNNAEAEEVVQDSFVEISATSSYDGVRTSAAPLEDGSIPITGSWTLDGDITGDVTLTGSNVSVPPNGDLGGTTDHGFTGTIDGLGTGTLTFSDEWVTDLRIGGVATTITVTGGTGDFEGATGSAELADRQITYEGNDELITGTITFTIVMPRSG